MTTFEDEFHCNLGRLVHETARFDFVVGLQLSWLGGLCGIDVSKELNTTKATLSTRLTKLQSLVGQAFNTAGPSAMAEFDAWFEQAASARALRNNYAHGRWGIPGKLAESSKGPDHPRVPMLAFVRLDWDMAAGQPDKSVYMTMQDFRAEVADAVLVFNAFFHLANKHLALVQETQRCLPDSDGTEGSP